MTRWVAMAAAVLGVAACGGSDEASRPFSAEPAIGACEAPACGGCGDCYSECLCSSNDAEACEAACAGGQAGSGGEGGSGASGGQQPGSGGVGALGGSVGVAGTDRYPSPDWELGDPADHGLDPDKLEAAATLAGENDTHCLVVVRNGVLVGEWYWGTSTPTTPHKTWSIAKSYSSALVGIAIERGDLQSLDQSAADFIPDWQGAPEGDVTIRQLVSMTSGLEWDLVSDYVGMAALSQDHSGFALGRKVQHAPGTHWTYNNAAVQVLEPVFRAATGMTIEEYAELYLWSKLGMQTAFWAKDPSGSPTAYASVMGSCRDHARFGYLFLRRGKWAGEQVVHEQYVDLSLSPQELNNAYGLLWWLNVPGPPTLNSFMQPYADEKMLPAAGEDHFGAHGFGNQLIDVHPSLDLVVVRLGKDPLQDQFDIGALVGAGENVREIISEALLDAVADG